MSKVKEFFTYISDSPNIDWEGILSTQHCRYTHKKCVKTRKSNPEISIGTCTVTYGKDKRDVIICPHRLLERRQIFIDCLHLLNSHTPGNELHIVPEVSIPGGSVDYVLVSTDKNRKVKDFVGIELQTMDTTGTVWPERQRLLQELGFHVTEDISDKTFGMNWKMTSKTILVQLLHKIETFESLNRHFVLIVQDHLLEYMKKEFSFSHVTDAKLGDCMHFHAYSLDNAGGAFKLHLQNRLSTDSAGISTLLGLNAKANIKFKEIATILESKISDNTVFDFSMI
ncbi:NotI family restriction endonuclease [Phocaeicola vulgatus]|uniref:NotI family restriction endonuclease n=1 Tax=Phocaeicola vulgatus TaxID=821 RepID=UPI001F25907B|nr:NotI family restriction endonuclease [Phocaeicola vulgatus]MCE8864143.1 hypothetical protein [Phocaeicola vulgatus]